ncbi:acyltransferase family protein [uncultured Fibrella sp.]|uniref:acyltransferase family protein n=1 Tax=uncultured Fibrella sp. TaxID=1284596 RepID=UPI0035C9C5C3
MNQKFTESSWAIFGGLRFTLAITVMVCHLIWFAPIPKALTPVLSLGGKAAVLSFLLISGVSIGYSFITQPDGYFKRRFLRIYPLYFASLVFTEIITLLLGSPYKSPGGLIFSDSGWQTPVANLFFMQGIFANTISYNNPLWSLSPEVLYYLIVPLLVRMRTEALLILFLISILAFAFYPMGWYFGYSALRYLWPWLIGFIYATENQSKLTVVLLTSGLGIIIFIGSDASTPLSWLTFSVTAVSLFIVSRSYFQLPNLCRVVLNFLGNLSYPIYLFHIPLLLFWSHYFDIRNPWLLLFFVVLSTIPINYIFDNWLKAIFWKPLVSKIGSTKRYVSFAQQSIIK